jgi:hypothetical protein
MSSAGRRRYESHWIFDYIRRDGIREGEISVGTGGNFGLTTTLRYGDHTEPAQVVISDEVVARSGGEAQIEPISKK